MLARKKKQSYFDSVFSSQLLSVQCRAVDDVIRELGRFGQQRLGLAEQLVIVGLGDHRLDQRRITSVLVRRQLWMWRKKRSHSAFCELK